MKFVSTHVYSGFEFVERYTPVIAEHLPTNVLADGGRSVELEQHVRLEDIFSPSDFLLGYGSTQPHPFSLNVPDHVVGLHRIAHEVNSPKTSVLVARVETLITVAEV